jgi:FlaG/FlaF family flagellin (archaellin)
MNRIKRFFKDEAAIAEVTSTVVMIAAVGILLAAGLIIWYTGVNTAFNTAGILFLGLIYWLISLAEKRS